MIEVHLRQQTFDAVLELAVLGGVDERVDAAVGEHQYHGEVVEPTDDGKGKLIEPRASQNDYWKTDEVVEPAREVDWVAEEVEQKVDLVWCPARDETAAHYQ